MAGRGESTVELGDKAGKSDLELNDDVISLPKASLNAAVMIATLLSVMHSFNLGLAITMPNNSQPAMMEVRDLVLLSIMKAPPHDYSGAAVCVCAARVW